MINFGPGFPPASRCKQPPGIEFGPIEESLGVELSIAAATLKVHAVVIDVFKPKNPSER